MFMSIRLRRCATPLRYDYFSLDAGIFRRAALRYFRAARPLISARVALF